MQKLSSEMVWISYLLANTIQSYKTLLFCWHPSSVIHLRQAKRFLIAPVSVLNLTVSFCMHHQLRI
jgi:hypothetical protein